MHRVIDIVPLVRELFQLHVGIEAQLHAHLSKHQTALDTGCRGFRKHTYKEKHVYMHVRYESMSSNDVHTTYAHRRICWPQ
jgi:hypothetical protein